MIPITVRAARIEYQVYLRYSDLVNGSSLFIFSLIAALSALRSFPGMRKTERSITSRLSILQIVRPSSSNVSFFMYAANLSFRITEICFRISVGRRLRQGKLSPCFICTLLCSFFLISVISRSYHIKKTTRSPRFLSKDLGRFIFVFYDALNCAVSPARQLFAWGFFCPWGGKGLCKGTK